MKKTLYLLILTFSFSSLFCMNTSLTESPNYNNFSIQELRRLSNLTPLPQKQIDILEKDDKERNVVNICFSTIGILDGPFLEIPTKKLIAIATISSMALMANRRLVESKGFFVEDSDQIPPKKIDTINDLPHYFDEINALLYFNVSFAVSGLLGSLFR